MIFSIQFKKSLSVHRERKNREREREESPHPESLDDAVGSYDPHESYGEAIHTPSLQGREKKEKKRRERERVKEKR